MRGLYIPDLEIPENCIGCNYRDPSYGNCCELMIDNPSDSFEEQYRLCPIRILCKNAVPAADVREAKKGRWINQGADSEICSACGSRFYISALFAVGINDEPNFCPNCGADMKEAI